MIRWFVDTNIFLYARGADHVYREPSRQVVEGVRRGTVRLECSTELVQEFVHVLARRGVSRHDALDEAAEVRRQCRVHAFDVHVLDVALGLLRRQERLGARDAVHAATAIVAGAPTILSADRAFDSVPGLERIDPVAAAAECAHS